MRKSIKVAALIAAGALTVLAATQVQAQVQGDGPDAPTLPAPSPRALGNGLTESKFVPVAPCRLYDSRTGAGRTPVGAGNFRILKVKGPEGIPGQYAGQGGKAGGCGIPAAATSVEVTITAVSPAGTGYLRAWASGQPEPTATFMNYIQGFNASNTGTIAVCTVSCGEASDMRIKAYARATHVVIDVQGYTTPPMAALVNAAGSLVEGSRVVTVSRPFQGQYLVTFDRTVHTCASVASVDGFTSNGYAMVGPDSADATRLYVFTSDANGALQNRGFHLLVTC